MRPMTIGELIPRKALALPPGQRQVRTFPRFAGVSVWFVRPEAETGVGSCNRPRVAVDDEAINDADRATEVVYPAAHLDPCASLGNGEVVDRQAEREGAGVDRPSSGLRGAMDGQAHCVVGEACDDTAVEKASTVAVLLANDEADRDRFGVGSRVEGSPGIGDRAASAVNFESVGHSRGDRTASHDRTALP